MSAAPNHPVFTLTFKKVRDEMPSDGMSIAYLDGSEFYGSVELKHGDVEWYWEEYDEDGHRTGTTVFWEDTDGQPMPENFKLYAAVDGETLQPEHLWFPISALDDLLDASEADGKARGNVTP